MGEIWKPLPTNRDQDLMPGALFRWRREPVRVSTCMYIPGARGTTHRRLWEAQTRMAGDLQGQAGNRASTRPSRRPALPSYPGHSGLHPVRVLDHPLLPSRPELASPQPLSSCRTYRSPLTPSPPAWRGAPKFRQPSRSHGRPRLLQRRHPRPGFQAGPRPRSPDAQGFRSI